MKKTIHTTLSVIASIIIFSCTSNLSDKAKAQNAVEHCIDSIWKGQQINIRGFANFITMKDHLEEEKKRAYKNYTDFFKYHTDMTERRRIEWRKFTDKYYADEMNRQKGYWITCFYNINFKQYEEDFWVEPDFKTVHWERIVEQLAG